MRLLLLAVFVGIFHVGTPHEYNELPEGAEICVCFGSFLNDDTARVFTVAQCGNTYSGTCDGSLHDSFQFVCKKQDNVDGVNVEVGKDDKKKNFKLFAPEDIFKQKTGVSCTKHNLLAALYLIGQAKDSTGNEYSIVLFEKELLQPDFLCALETELKLENINIYGVVCPADYNK